MSIRCPFFTILRIHMPGITWKMGTHMYPLECSSILYAPTRHTVAVRGRIAELVFQRHLGFPLPLYVADITCIIISDEGSTPMTQFPRLFFREELLRHLIRWCSATAEVHSATTEEGRGVRQPFTRALRNNGGALRNNGGWPSISEGFSERVFATMVVGKSNAA